MKNCFETRSLPKEPGGLGVDHKEIRVPSLRMGIPRNGEGSLSKGPVVL